MQLSNKVHHIVYISVIIVLFFTLFAVINSDSIPEISEIITDSGECKLVMLYLDSDGDGYGSGESFEKMCEDIEPPLGYTTKTGDCDDGNSSMWRSLIAYKDSDGDGYSTEQQWRICTNNQAPRFYLSEKSEVLDCDDSHKLVYPGSDSPETASSLDNNCNRQKDLEMGTIFVTSKKYHGNLGGLDGADEKCQEAAQSPDIELGGMWIAFLSTSRTDAIDRLPDTSYFNANNILIGKNKTDLFKGWIEDEIKFTEFGKKSYDYVWTGSGEDGRYHKPIESTTCSDWSSDDSSMRGVIGSTRTTNSRWFKEGESGCSTGRALFCVKVI